MRFLDTPIARVATLGSLEQLLELTESADDCERDGRETH